MVFILSLCITAAAQDKAKTKNEKAKEVKAKKEKGKKKNKFKEYDEVITKEAKTKKGIITTHMVDENLYYEIPAKVIGKEFLWVTQLSKAQTGFGYSGTPTAKRVVRWERHGDKVLLRDIKYQLHAKEGTPEAIVVKASSIPAVIGSYKIVCFAKDKTPVVDVTKLFTGDVPEFSPKRRLNAAAIDKNRTFITSVKAFPLNVEVRVLATYKPKPPKPVTGAARFFRRGPQANTISVEVHHSMVKLPDKPAMARLADKRVGYFGHTFEDYSGKDQQKVDQVSVIHRFRLEKKYPGAKLSEPKKPIVFYVGRGVPEKYKPYVKQGIDDWQGAFEQAGFKKAIIGKYAPSAEEDPDWDAEDARYSTIRWLPSTIKNAMGPHVVDPRSGETLEADVLMYHNVLHLLRDWFYVQASPNLPGAQKLPLSDELMGKLLRNVVSHEVGHSLGLRHNFKASSGVTIKQLRDPVFTEKNGHTPSIMDYARFNYVAQPGDGAVLIPRIGPYDRFAIEWGYKQFPGIKDPQDEKPFLNKIAARQLTDPLLRFGSGRGIGPEGGSDHTAQTEDLGSDAIEATRLGLKNLKRIMGYLVEGTSKEGEDYTELKNMYDMLIFQYTLEIGHVARLVGGVENHNKVYGMKGDVFTPLDVPKQEAAVKFLIERCFSVPGFLLDRDLIKRLGMHDISKQIGNAQSRMLRILLNSQRAALIGDIEASGYKTYPVFKLVGDITAGIFSEMSKSGAKIGVLRRNLQRTYTEMLTDNLVKKDVNGDLRAASRFHLKQLAEKLKVYSAGNDITRSHVMDLLEQIISALKAERKIDS
jgi:hypothetical protein